jgi:hypothetical protein
MNPLVRSAFFEFNEEYDPAVRHLYVDKSGQVMAVWTPIPEDEVTLYTWYRAYSDESEDVAPGEEVQAEWQAVNAARALAKDGPDAFDKITHLVLADGQVQHLALAKLDRFEETLKKTAEFADLDDWPADAQLGILSMAWALGPSFGPRWPKFRAACKARDWFTAGRECIISTREFPDLAFRNFANLVLFSNAGNAGAGGSPDILVFPTDLRVAEPMPPRLYLLSKGDTGPGVSFLQRHLDYAGMLEAGATDGELDDATERSVIAYQAAVRIPQDGITDDDTWTILLSP